MHNHVTLMQIVPIQMHLPAYQAPVHVMLEVISIRVIAQHVSQVNTQLVRIILSARR